MGAVKEALINQITWAARQSGQEEDELLSQWNENLKARPEKMESIESFIARQKEKRRKK